MDAPAAALLLLTWLGLSVPVALVVGRGIARYRGGEVAEEPSRRPEWSEVRDPVSPA